MKAFLNELKVQRWDDHRYYHHSRINQTLHLISALSFVGAYLMLYFDPVISALIGWLVSMTTRQAGHFFFEPKGYDHVNDASHEYKERIKVGYNLRRKVVLMGLWFGTPLLLWYSPDLLGLLSPIDGFEPWIRRVGAIWLTLGIGAVLFRGLHLFVLRDARTGLVWMTKILTDPFHDIVLYRNSPLHLLRGERIAPGPDHA